MTLNDFFKKYKSGVDYDGYYGKQCVDYANAFAKEVYGVKNAFVGPYYAYQIYTDYGKYPTINKNFTRIANDSVKLNHPSRGDFIIWAKERNGTAGHIAIVVSADEHNITVIEQNYDGKGSVRKHTYTNYNYVLGWLRLKNSKKNTPTVKAGQIVRLAKRAVLYNYDSSQSGVKQLSDFSNFSGDAILKVGAHVQVAKVKTKANKNIWAYVDKYKAWFCVYDYQNDVSKI